MSWQRNHREKLELLQLVKWHPLVQRKQFDVIMLKISSILMIRNIDEFDAGLSICIFIQC